MSATDSGQDRAPRISVVILTSSENRNILKRVHFLANGLSSQYESSLLVTSEKPWSQRGRAGLLSAIKLVLRPPEIVHVVEPWFAGFPIIFLIAHRSRLIYQTGNINFENIRITGSSFLISRVLKFIELMYVRLARVIFTDDISMIPYFRNINDSAKVFFVPEELNPVSIYQRGDAISDNDSPDEIPVVGYVANIHLMTMPWGQKLPRGWELVMAAKKLEEMGHLNMRFVVVGGGKGLPELKKFVHSNGLDSHFTLTGEVDDQEKDRWISKFHVGFQEDYSFLSTHRYNLGHKVKEYMAMGVPVVTGWDGDKGRLISGRLRCGICVRPLSHQDGIGAYIGEIAEALAKMIDDQDMHRAMAENCIKLSSRLLDEGRIMAEVRTIYGRFLVGNHGD